MSRKIMPPRYFTILLIISIGLHFVFPVKIILHTPYTYGGIILIVFGIVINIWADALFKKTKTPVKPHEIPTYLELTGPFRISRHPMYLGMAAILLGVAILLGSPITFIFPVLYVILMEILFIQMEELNLERRFGKQYLDYRKKTRRWV